MIVLSIATRNSTICVEVLGSSSSAMSLSMSYILAHSHSIHIAGDYGALTEFSLGPFNNNVRELSFNVSIVDDTIPEEDEVFIASLTLSPGNQATFGNLVIVVPDSANFTIQDEDGKLYRSVPAS